ncbi:hypothetical protein [Reinekea sp.]|uniref:hypothetical protein n=1 Tax=Reinekea sp. TaxID=1970455 RepID=UPI002A80608B|nr:hypothetical protein [Reinekea sp.]
MSNQVLTILSFSDNANPMQVNDILTNADGDFRFQDHIPVPSDIDNPSARANWRLRHWGCEFDVESQDGYFIQGGLLIFCTKLSHPKEALLQISKKLSDLVITVQYASDQLGADQGDYEINNGVVISLMAVGDGIDFAEFLWSEYGDDARGQKV